MTTTNPGALDPDAAHDVNAELIIELLTLSEEFLRHAGPGVRTELAAFLAGQGLHPATALGWFIDALGMTALQLRAQSTTSHIHEGTPGGQTHE